MKKILLGTTTLIGAASLMAGAALAETPKVTLGGYSDFQLGVVGEDQDSDERSGAFRSDNVLTFNIDAKSDSGFGYGAFIELHADVSQDSQDAKDSGGTARRTYMYIDGNWGRFQYGSDFGVTKTMKIDASSIARATGGIDGDFKLFQIATSGQVIATPDLFLDYGNLATQLGNRSSENINKVSYYTPRFSGFQAGISYLFDTTSGDRGQTLTRADATSGEAENVFLGGLTWEGKWDQVSIGLAATGEWGNAEATATEDLQTWNVGGKIGYMGFSVAGSYGDWGDSLAAANSGLDDRSYWTAGIAYETGPFGISATWLDSNYEVSSTTDNEFDNLSVGVDYKLAPGLTPYAEVSFFDLDPTGTANDNDGTVFIAGTQLAF